MASPALRLVKFSGVNYTHNSPNLKMLGLVENDPEKAKYVSYSS